MGNVLEFYLKMKDMMSSGLVKVAQTAKQSFAKVENTISSSVSKGSKEAVNSLDQINNKLKEVDRTASSSSLFGGGLLRRFAPAAIAGTLAISGGAFLKASAEQYIDFQKNNKSYEVLAGNRGIGQTLAGDLNHLKQDTIMGPAVYQNAKTMMSFGIGADKVIDNLKMLGDVSMGDAERLGSLTLAFSQTQAAGKLMGQDLLQYVNAGFNPLNEISKKTGRSMADLRTDMQNGKISAEMVAGAFKHATEKGGLFYNMLNQMSETTGGKLQNLHGKVAALEIAIGERLAPSMNIAVDSAIEMVTWFKHLVEIPVEKKLYDQITQIKILQSELTASNTSHARQVELLHELEQINPNITKGINEQSIEYGKLANNINSVTGALQNKILLEKMQKDYGGVLADYATLTQRKAEAIVDLRRRVYRAAPDLAERTDMTDGQKQVAAVQRLLQKSGKFIDSHPGSGFNPYGQELQYLQGAAGTASKFNKELNQLQPTINKINGEKNALLKTTESVLGVKSMTAAQINGGKGNNSTTATTDSKTAKGITGGGPRVINISGVNMKFADKIEVHANNPKELMAQLEPQMDDYWMRLLNSGSNVQ